MVKAFATNLHKNTQNKIFFVFTQSMVTFNLKMISIKSVFTSNLTFINL